MNTLDARQDIPSIYNEGGWVDILHVYHFADAAAAAVAAAVARRCSPDAKDDPAQPEAFHAFLASFRSIGQVRARMDVQVQDQVLSATISVREDVADEDIEGDEDVADGVKPCRSEQLHLAFGALMRAMGGLTRRALDDRLDAERRAKDLATLHGRNSTAPELLAALEAVDGDLRRYEKIFVDSLRLSIKTGNVGEGQRLDASKILARVADAKRA